MNESRYEPWVFGGMLYPVAIMASGTAPLRAMGAALGGMLLWWMAQIAIYEKEAPIWLEAVQALWTGVVIGQILSALPLLWDGEIGKWLPLAVLMLSGWSASKGKDASVSASIAVSWAAAILIAAGVLLPLRNLNPERMAEAKEINKVSHLWLILLPMACTGGKPGWKSKWKIVAAAGIISLFAVNTLGKNVQWEQMPLLTASRSTNYLGAIERGESLMAVGLIISAYLTASMLAASTIRAKNCCHLAVIAAAAAWLIPVMPEGKILLIGSILAWFLAPAVFCKNRKKLENNC